MSPSPERDECEGFDDWFRIQAAKDSWQDETASQAPPGNMMERSSGFVCSSNPREMEGDDLCHRGFARQRTWHRISIAFDRDTIANLGSDIHRVQ